MLEPKAGRAAPKAGVLLPKAGVLDPKAGALAPNRPVLPEAGVAPKEKAMQGWQADVCALDAMS